MNKFEVNLCSQPQYKKEFNQIYAIFAVLVQIYGIKIKGTVYRYLLQYKSVAIKVHNMLTMSHKNETNTYYFILFHTNYVVKYKLRQVDYSNL